MTAVTTHSRTTESQRLAWVPWAAIVGGAMLLAMSALVIGSGDELPDAPLVALYFGGMLVAFAAAVGAALRLPGGLAKRVAIGVGLALATLLFIITGISQPLFSAMSDATWVEDEGPIGLLGVIYIGLGLWGASRDRSA